MTNSTTSSRALRGVVVLLAGIASIAFVAARASAQSPITDPYTGAGVSSGAQTQVPPNMSISVTSAVPGQRVRIQACLLAASSGVRITLNPGTQANQGTPCPGATIGGTALPKLGRMQLIGVASSPLQNVLLQTGTTSAPCPFDHPVDALPADTTANGTIGLTSADKAGCVDTFVTVPDRPPGAYQLCAVPAGAQTVCSVIRIASATSPASGGTGGTKVLGEGFARTGLELLPFLVIAVLAIVFGRALVRRSGAARN